MTPATAATFRAGYRQLVPHPGVDRPRVLTRLRSRPRSSGGRGGAGVAGEPDPVDGPDDVVEELARHLERPEQRPDAAAVAVERPVVRDAELERLGGLGMDLRQVLQRLRDALRSSSIEYAMESSSQA